MYGCCECWEEYDEEENLVKHIREKHDALRCEICGKIFSNLSNKKAHWLRHTSPVEIYECVQCHKNFKNKYAYKNHLLTHEIEIQCEQCGRTFSSKYKLKNHNNRGCSSRKAYKLDECPVCHKKGTKRDLIHHYADHGIFVETQLFFFNDLSSFKEWKNSIENETQTKFVICNKYSLNKKKRIFYECYRSGYFTSIGKGLRPRSDTNKINGYCPASIRASITDNVEVEYIKTHVGHEKEWKRLRLTKAERNMLADKINDKVPFDEILDSVKNSNEKSPRIRHLKKKDLFNIARDYKINSAKYKTPDMSEKNDSNGQEWVEDIHNIFKPIKQNSLKTQNDMENIELQDESQLIIEIIEKDEFLEEANKPTWDQKMSHLRQEFEQICESVVTNDDYETVIENLRCIKSLLNRDEIPV